MPPGHVAVVRAARRPDRTGRCQGRPASGRAWKYSAGGLPVDFQYVTGLAANRVVHVVSIALGAFEVADDGRAASAPLDGDVVDLRGATATELARRTAVWSSPVLFVLTRKTRRTSPVVLNGEVAIGPTWAFRDSHPSTESPG